MGNINLIRIDSRLIHGQVITKWLKISKASKIIIVDDELAQDTFMASIYTTAAPKGVKVEILEADEVIEKYNNGQLCNEDIMVLFKDVPTCYNLFSKGFPMKNIQIGGLPSAPGRTTILRAVSINADDMNMLKEIDSSGTEIIIHIIPEESKMEFDKMVKKFGN